MTDEEQENASDVMMELIEHHENLRRFEPMRKKSQGNSCLRCNSERMTSSGFDYCPDCNWDSLEGYSITRTQ